MATNEQVTAIAKAMGWPTPAVTTRVYLIVYDLKEKTGKYAELETALKDAGAIQIQKSAWVLKSTEATANAIVQQFKANFSFTSSLDTTEKLFVTEIGSNAGGWLAQVAWPYIKS